MFLSNKSSPEGLTVALTVLPPNLYVKEYSPVGCLLGDPAATNLNNPQFPGNFKGSEVALELFPFCKNLLTGALLLLELLLGLLTDGEDEFAEEFVAGEV